MERLLTMFASSDHGLFVELLNAAACNQAICACVLGSPQLLRLFEHVRSPEFTLSSNSFALLKVGKVFPVW